MRQIYPLFREGFIMDQSMNVRQWRATEGISGEQLANPRAGYLCFSETDAKSLAAEFGCANPVGHALTELGIVACYTRFAPDREAVTAYRKKFPDAGVVAYVQDFIPIRQ